MTDSILLRETRGHIRILTINRPERSNAMSPELTEELIDAFVDGGAGGDAVHVEQLEGAEAEGDENFGIEFGVGAVEQGMDLVIKEDLPAKYAKDEGCGQVAVSCGQGVDGSGAKKIVGVGVAALDG